jgi:hypothetical protein
MTRDSPATSWCAWLGVQGAGEGARRRPAVVAARAGAPAKGQRGLDDTRASGVKWMLGKVPEWLGGFGGGHRKMSSSGGHGEPATEPAARRSATALNRGAASCFGAKASSKRP